MVLFYILACSTKSIPRKRLQYNRENLELAVREHQEGLMSIRGLARAYSVPETTLRDRIKGRIALDAVVGQKTIEL